MRTVVTSLIGTLFLFCGMVCFLTVALCSVPAGLSAAVLVMALRGFLRPAFGPAARDAHPLPDLLGRMVESAALLVEQLVFLLRELFRWTVVICDTRGRLGRPVIPFVPAGMS